MKQRDFFKLLQKLTENRVWYCVQSQNKSEFYNISVDDIHGKTHYINSGELDEVEERLKVIWGHLLEPEQPAKPTSPLPLPKGLPPL